MSIVYMTRHGQANTGARDHDSYDKLSPLGHQQAQWLGTYFSQTKMTFDRIISGSLRRQKETAAGLNHADLTLDIDERLNEIDYFGLAQDLEEKFSIPFPDTQEEFAKQMQLVLAYWKEGKIASTVENFETFHTRILSVLNDALNAQDRVLLVSSTGVIASIVAELLSVPIQERNKLFLSVMHTSLHRFERVSGMLTPTLFCATPHLEHPEKHFARTYI